VKSSKPSNAIYCASFANFAPRSQDASRDRENAETGDAEQRRARVSSVHPTAVPRTPRLARANAMEFLASIAGEPLKYLIA
ncbi:MAG TPA: hypothetical protein VJS37_16090, partial [Terriglobales bacterium]|nr:hypothetical protein [Terriglobales bacterium]